MHIAADFLGGILLVLHYVWFSWFRSHLIMSKNKLPEQEGEMILYDNEFIHFSQLWKNYSYRSITC